MTHTRRDEADAPGPLADGGGFWPLLGKGMAMGVAEVVPGVSGGTIAFVAGIYDPLVRAFASFSQLSLKLLASDWRGFARKHNLAFLAVLGAGMAIGFAAVAQVVLWLLASYGVHVFGLFFGLIAGAVFAVGAQSQWRWLGTIGVAGLAIGLAVGLLVEPAAMRTEPSTALLFAAGALAATAWILPGVSGSFVLLLLGLYQPLLQSLKALELATVATFLAGVGIGLLAFSKLLAWLLEKWRAQVLALLTGVLAGSLTQIWPWRYAAEDDSPMLVGVVAAMLLGVLVVAGLTFAARRRQA